MLDDHYVICKARNYLADALKALLKADIMTNEDFKLSREAASAAVMELDYLIRKAE
jgi:hypothetical protein